MSNLLNHAMIEFRAAKFIDENNQYCDEMQESICKNVLRLIEIFSEEGHSGSSASYAINLFKQLALFEPIVPLTGEDWEWHNISEYSGHDNGPVFQNKRCSHVFKDDNGAYDIDGKIFWEWYTDKETGEKSKTYYTSYGSRVPVTFPYTPKREYVYRESNNE